MKKKSTIYLIVSIITLSLITICIFEKIDNAEYKEYNSVIQEFHSIINSVYSDEFEEKYNSFAFLSPNENLQYEWSCMIVDMYSNRKKHTYGYLLYDFDQNGVKELFLVRDDYFVLAIFTIQDNSLCMLDAFWSKHKCKASSGDIYIFDSITAQDFNCYVKTYDQATTSLITIKNFGCNKGVYYEEVDNEIIKIDFERYKDLESPSVNNDFYNKNIKIISPK